MAKKHFETDAIRAQMERSENNEHSVPVYLTSSFVFDTAEEMRAAFNEESNDFIYSRYTNPNVDEFNFCKTGLNLFNIGFNMF